jgi:hypothetical protein
MNKIEFEENVFIYRTKIASKYLQENALVDTLYFLKNAPYSQQDNYTYIGSWSSFDFENEIRVINGIDEIIRLSVLECVSLVVKNNQSFNKINLSAWVNVVRAKNPRQVEFKSDGEVKLHNHIDIQNNIESFYPTYTFVYYAQMPDSLNGNDGTLIIGGNNKKYYYLPEVGDLIVMGGGLPHSPNLALNSTKDRIVIAGNVGFEYVKQKHSLI